MLSQSQPSEAVTHTQPRMVLHKRAPRALAAFAVVCCLSITYASLCGKDPSSPPSSPKGTVRSFNFKPESLFMEQKGRDIIVAARTLRKRRRRRRVRKIKKNMKKTLVSRNKSYVKRSSKRKRYDRRQIIRRSRPQRQVKRIVRRRRRRWRRIPRGEVRRMKSFGKKLIDHGRKLMMQGKVTQGKRLIRKAKKAVDRLRKLEHGFRLESYGKKLLKAGKRGGRKYVKIGVQIQKALGNTSKIQLPGYETMNASRKMNPKKPRNPHHALPRKKDVELLKSKFSYGKKLLAHGRRLIQRGDPKKGRKLIQQAKKALKSIKKLDHGYRLIMHGRKLIAAGQTKKGNELMRRGFKIKMSYGSGQYILPGWQTMNAPSRPSSVKGIPKKNHAPKRKKPGRKGKKNRHRSIPKKKDISLLRNKYKYGKMLLRQAQKLIQKGNPKKGRKLMQQAKKAIKNLKKLEKGYGLILHGKKLIAAGETKKGNELMRRGFKIKMSLGSGQYIQLPGWQTMNASRRPSSVKGIQLPPSGSHPRIARPPSAMKDSETKTAYPISCQCKQASGLKFGACYEFTDRDYSSRIRSCKKRNCKPSYVCVAGAKTGITCIRKKNTHKTVAVGIGTCRKKTTNSYMYVPYST